MRPISFHEDETIIKAPPDRPEVFPIHAVGVEYEDGTPVIITCWRPEPREARRLFGGDPVYVAVMGERQPALFLSADPEESWGSEFARGINIEKDPGGIPVFGPGDHSKLNDVEIVAYPGSVIMKATGKNGQVTIRMNGEEARALGFVLNTASWTSGWRARQ